MLSGELLVSSNLRLGIFFIWDDGNIRIKTISNVVLMIVLLYYVYPPSSVMMTDTCDSGDCSFILSRNSFITSWSSLSVTHHPTGWPLCVIQSMLLLSTRYCHDISYVPAAKSSGTIKVISLNLYAFVPCVQSMHKILWQNWWYSCLWNSVWRIIMKESLENCGRFRSSLCWGLKYRIGLYSSCLSASTANCTEVASSVCLILEWSCILHLILRMSCLETKCFLVTVSPNSLRLLLWPISSLISK